MEEIINSLDGNGKVTKLKDKINTKKTKITADEYWAEHGATKKARSRAATAVKRYRKQLEAAEEKLWNLREGKWRERLIFKQEYITTPLIVNNIKNIYELCQED